jgi:L-2-amino-thiazoline-4-carboxylic acid hydrolase
MSEETLRKQLYDSFANRAQIHHLLFKQLREEIGIERAAELMGKAIYQRGVELAGEYARFAPRDLAGLKESFVGRLPDDGAMFAPEVVRCAADGLDIKFHRCPLKQAWLDAGLDEKEVAQLCHIAAQVDQGLFTAAGFAFHADTYQPGAEGCCFLHIRPGHRLGSLAGL